MANEIQFRHYATGVNLYAIIINSAGQVLNENDEWESIAVGGWDTYARDLIETPPASQWYFAAFPSISAGTYQVMIFERVGASPTISDQMHGSGELVWDGSAEVDLSGIAMAGSDSDTIKTISDQIDSLNNISTAEVNAEVDTALADYDPPTKAELDAAQAAIQADKTGYKLASDGLDSIASPILTGVASTFIEKMEQLWRFAFRKHDLDKTGAGSGLIRTYADDGETVLTTQQVSDDGTRQTVGAAN